MTEADVQRKLGKYYRRVAPPYTIAYELKLIKGPSFSFSRLADHQLTNLLMAENGLHYKISDTSSSTGRSNKKPFDAVYIKSQISLVVLCFWKPREYTRCFFIPAKEYVLLRELHPRKSIRMDELLDFEVVDL